MIITKADKNSILVTAPVLVPNEKDCDYNRGEKPLNQKEIAYLAHSFLKYAIIDKDHDYLFTKQKIGDPVESYILTEEKSFKGIDGSVRTYPIGTWIMTTEITDSAIINQIKKGVYTGFSVTAVNKDKADNLISKKSSEAGLIKDIKDPVAFTVSLVKKPCVNSAKICSIKNRNGDEIMEAEDKKLLETIKNRLSFKGDIKNNDDNDVEYALKSDLDDFATKSDLEGFKGEVIDAIVTSVKECLSQPKKKTQKADMTADDKKKMKDTENTGNNDAGATDDSSNSDNNTNNTNNNSNNNSSNNNTDTGMTEEEKKKQQVSSKGLKVHKTDDTVAIKSDAQIVYEIMGRDSTGSKLRE